MKKIYCIIISLSLFYSCSTVPITGRKQLDIVPASQMLSMSSTEYKTFMTQNKLSGNAEQTALVKRVGQNIADAVTKYMQSKGMTKELKGYNWEFNLVEDPQVNAWCMPGGKVVVYTGILPLTIDEKGLAVVLGHEISHAIAQHGAERMSQGLLTQLGGVALSVATSTQPAATQNLFYQAYGAGTEVGILLPFSRKDESEADHLGLVFMAMAGYNPETAVGFWQRMLSYGSSQQKPPAYLSDHPSDAKRIQEIQKEMPEAMTYYNSASVKR